MQLLQNVQQVFVQLSDSIEQLTNEQYTARIPLLSDATIGQHVRHTVELFICLEKDMNRDWSIMKSVNGISILRPIKILQIHC